MYKRLLAGMLLTGSVCGSELTKQHAQDYKTFAEPGKPIVISQGMTKDGKEEYKSTINQIHPNSDIFYAVVSRGVSYLPLKANVERFNQYVDTLDEVIEDFFDSVGIEPKPYEIIKYEQRMDMKTCSDKLIFYCVSKVVNSIWIKYAILKNNKLEPHKIEFAVTDKNGGLLEHDMRLQGAGHKLKVVSLVKPAIIQSGYCHTGSLSSPLAELFHYTLLERRRNALELYLNDYANERNIRTPSQLIKPATDFGLELLNQEEGVVHALIDNYLLQNDLDLSSDEIETYFNRSGSQYGYVDLTKKVLKRKTSKELILDYLSTFDKSFLE